MINITIEAPTEGILKDVISVIEKLARAGISNDTIRVMGRVDDRRIVTYDYNIFNPSRLHKDE